MTNRYDTSDNAEGQYQPGSHGGVLVNLLGVTSVDEMDDVELVRLDKMQSALLNEIEIDQRIRADDLRNWHKRWLGDVYKWAGEYRTVNMQKGDFLFAASNLIPKLMQDYEKNYLNRFTPCNGFDAERLIEALSVCHVELIIIHPFREGNGRLARVLATIMALQAGMPLLDFTYMTEHKDEYIGAIHAGHSGDYEPMKRIFAIILKASQSEAD